MPPKGDERRSFAALNQADRVNAAEDDVVGIGRGDRRLTDLAGVLKEYFDAA